MFEHGLRITLIQILSSEDVYINVNIKTPTQTEPIDRRLTGK